MICDKVIIFFQIISEDIIYTLGDWAEYLVAESKLQNNFEVPMEF